MTLNGYARLILAASVFAAVGVQAAAPPNLARIEGTPSPLHGKIYADCLAQATSGGAYDRTSDKDTHLLRFRCSGAPAKAFYDELGAWSAARGSQWTADGRSWRATGKIVHDLFGTDYCSSGGDADYVCEVTLNVGPFLDS